MNIWQYRDVVHQKRTTLTNEQIKNLPSTPISVIGPPGPNNIIVAPIYGHDGGAVLVLNWFADYANISNDATFGFTLGSNGPYANYGGNNHVKNFFQWGIGGTYKPFWPISSNDDNSGGSVQYNGLSDFENQELFINLYNAAGLLTGGDEQNTLDVIVYYLIYDIYRREFTA